MNYFKYFNILILTTLSLYSVILEVHSIDCPHATAWPISAADLKNLEHYYINKYYIASNFAQNIFFPAEYRKLCYMRFEIEESEPPIIRGLMFTYHSALNNNNVARYQRNYYFKMDTSLPIFELDRQYVALKFALVYMDEESNNSFSIYQSCDGKYAWAHIIANSDHGRNLFEELNDKINTAFLNLNIENGVIYNTSDNRLIYGEQSVLLLPFPDCPVQ